MGAYNAYSCAFQGLPAQGGPSHGKECQPWAELETQ